MYLYYIIYYHVQGDRSFVRQNKTYCVQRYEITENNSSRFYILSHDTKLYAVVHFFGNLLIYMRITVV